jgi:glutathione peroxidase-family protein
MTIYDYAWNTLSGKPFNMDLIKGKVVLIVNTASKCGFTPQYEGLQKLHEKYSPKGLVILGFPCNQFGSQEPGTQQEISEFCQVNYGVSFPMMDKIQVNGDNEHPLYKYLKNEKPGLLGLKMIKWNFEKFLVNKDGVVVDRFASTTSPASISSNIEKLL